MVLTAKVYLETIQDGNRIYQNFRIVVSNEKFLYYFFDDRFNAYYDLYREISKHLVGDGENVLFDSKSIYKNLISISFSKKNPDLDVKLPEDCSFEVTTKIPNNNGCINCRHFRNKNRICTYYQIFLDKLLDECKDFRQK